LLRLEPKTFMGLRRRSWSSPDLCVDLSHYSAGCTFPKHGHVDAFFCFVLNGACEEQANGRRDVLRPGSLIYHPAGFEHSNRWHEEGRCMHIEFVPAFWEGVDPVRLADPAACAASSRAGAIARSIYEELLRIDAVSGIAFEGLALLLLAETIREAGHERKPPRWLRAIRERLYEEYASAPSLRQLAADAGVHPTYLATSFQQHFGVSVGEFVRLRRIEQARELLAHSDIPLSHVAHLLGFSDQSHFCRTFKKQTGLSPLEYRRLIAQNHHPIQES
jgi:AraC family transcriptional regulator